MSNYRLALLAAALACAQAASAVTLTGTATPTTVSVGSTTTLTYSLNLSDPISELWNVTVNLDWDAGLSFETASAQVFGQSLSDFAAQFDPGSSYVGPSATGGLGVNLVPGLVPPSLAAGAATMSFTFTGLSVGVQNVHLKVELTTGGPDFDTIELNGSPQTLDSTVTVTAAVPEIPPASMLVAGLGVIGLLAYRRRS